MILELILQPGSARIGGEAAVRVLPFGERPFDLNVPKLLILDPMVMEGRPVDLHRSGADSKVSDAIFDPAGSQRSRPRGQVRGRHNA